MTAELIIAVLAGITTTAGAIVALISHVRSNKSEQRTAARCAELERKVTITREGIVQAFRDAKVDTNWKIDISNKVDSKLRSHEQRVIDLLLEHLNEHTQHIYFNTKILANTAAYGSLSKEEQEALERIMDSAAKIIEIEEVADEPKRKKK